MITEKQRSPNRDLAIHSTLNGSDCPDMNINCSPLFSSMFTNNQQSFIDYQKVNSFQQKQLKAELKETNPKKQTYTKKLLSPISLQNKNKIKLDRTKDQSTGVVDPNDALFNELAKKSRDIEEGTEYSPVLSRNND